MSPRFPQEHVVALDGLPRISSNVVGDPPEETTPTQVQAFRKYFLATTLMYSESKHGPEPFPE